MHHQSWTIKSIFLVVIIYLLIMGIWYTGSNSKWYLGDYVYNLKQHMGDYNDSIKQKEQQLQKDESERNMEDMKQAEINKKVKVHLDLAKQYYSGVADKYDVQGNKVKGIEPNFKEAVNHMSKAINYGYYQGYYDLLKIYNEGMYNFNPDISLAYSLYNIIIGNEDIPEEFRMHIIDEFSDLEGSYNNHTTYSWLNLKMPARENKKHNEWKNLNKTKSNVNVNNNGWNNHTPNTGDNDLNTLDALFRTNTGFNTDFIGNHVNINQSDVKKTRVAPVALVANDAHNVHDSSVLKSIGASLEKLKNSTNVNMKAIGCKNDFKDYVQDNYENNDKTQDVLKALDSVMLDVPMTHTDLTLRDTFELVWNRVRGMSNAEQQTTAKENLYNEMSEMIEHNKPVCVSGRYTRMVDSLNMVDDEVKIIPQSTVKNEMISKASKLSDDYYKTLDDNTRKEVEMGTHAQQETFDNKHKGYIEDELKKEYVDSGLVTGDDFEKQKEEWIDYV
jgi:hypothetical protein